MNRNLFPEYAGRIQALLQGDNHSPAMLIGTERTKRLYYIPFEHVNRLAKLVIVGITPGNNQLELAYNKVRELMAVQATNAEILVEVKKEAAFGGPAMRPNLLRMMRAFGFADLFGVESEESFWGSHAHLLHSTSVVPHAAFVGDKMFAGPFQAIMESKLFRECFEDCFVASLRDMQRDALYVGLGRTPLSALDWCVAQGVIRRDQVLGAFAHPARSGGSAVDYYLRIKRRESMKPNDPVLLGGRAEWLDQAYTRMKSATEALHKGQTAASVRQTEVAS